MNSTTIADDIRPFPVTCPAQSGALMWAFTALTLCFALQVELVFNRPVNWDEFYHLSEVHAFQQGRLHEALQVLYARAFFWLPYLPVDAVDQIRVARLLLLGFEAFTTFAIYRMAHRFTDQLAATLAALAYVSGGYVFEHGFSFRADPMAAAFLMGALWIMLESRLGQRGILATALLVALGTLSTIKIVIYSPAFAGVAWLRWRESDDRRAMLLRLGALAVISILVTVLAIGATILTLPTEGTARASKTVTTSATMVFNEGLFPQRWYAILACAMAPTLAILVLITPFELRRSLLSRDRRLALFGLFLPLASIIIYRNSFPYFYAYILAPVAVAAAISIQELIKRFPSRLLVVALASSAVIASARTPREVLPAQKEVLSAVHDIFPDPVRYFDFPGMIVDFPKENFFMTTWGVRKYWIGLEPSFSEVMAREIVPLLVVNQDTLVRNQTGNEPAWELHERDGLALREGYIPHWGPLWVAGHIFPAAQLENNFTIYAPGTYTMEGATAVIDGNTIAAGATITLARGSHSFVRSGAGEVRLRWGDHLKKPPKPFSGKPVFKDF